MIARHEGNISNLRIVNRSLDFFDMVIDVEVADVKHLADITAALRATRQDITAKKLVEPKRGATRTLVKATELQKGDVVLVEAGDMIPLDGEVVAATPQEFSVARNALDVLVPQGSTAATKDADD